MVQKLVNGKIKDLQDFNVGGIKVYSSANKVERNLKHSKYDTEAMNFNQNEENGGEKLTGMNLF